MLNDIFEQLTKLQNSKKAKEMSAYMKNKFEFLGVDSKSRKNIENNIFKEYKKQNILILILQINVLRVNIESFNIVLLII